MADGCCSAKGQELDELARQADQRRVLIAVLAINSVMFVLEFGAGVIAGSAALMADSVDMFGDALPTEPALGAHGPRATDKQLNLLRLLCEQKGWAPVDPEPSL